MRIQWGWITDFQLPIDGKQIGKSIKSSKEAYWILCQTSNRVHNQVPFSYKDCKSIFGIDLTSTEDGHLKVLLINLKEIWQDNTMNLICFYIREFLNQLNINLGQIPY